MGDYTVVAAALAGAAAGVLLLRLANTRDRRAAGDRTPPPPAEPATPTWYVRRPVQTAAPILLAVGLALIGVGLAIGSGHGALDVRPLLPGAVVLLAALLAVVRQGGHARPPGGQAPGGDVTTAEAGDGDGVAVAADRHPREPDTSAPPHRR